MPTYLDENGNQIANAQPGAAPAKVYLDDSGNPIRAASPAPAAAPQEGFWESLGHSLGIGTEEGKAEVKDVQEHPLVTMLKAAIPGYDAAKAALQGGKRIAQEQGQALEELGRGNVAGAGVHAVQSLPFVGPGIARGAEQLGPGEWINPAEVGTALGTAIQAAPALLGAVDTAFPARPIVSAPSVPSLLGDMITKPRGTVPAESASPLELKAYADESGIPLNAAQATQHSLPLNLQSVGERATIGGTPVRQQVQAGQAALIDHAQRLMNGMSPDTPDLGKAGEKIQQNVAAALDREKQVAQRDYAAIDGVARGVTVDLKPIKQLATSLLNDSDFIRQNISSLDPKRASLVVQGAQRLPDSATFTQAQQLRSSLLDEARHPDNVINQQGQGWIKALSGAVDDQMQTAAESTPDLLNKFRAANAHWEGMQEAFNNPRSPLYQALQETDPNKVPQKFTGKGQIGGSPYNAELLDRYGIDKAPVKWALLNDMIAKDFGLYQGGKSLAGYSDPFLRSMFEPGELDSIYKTGAIARSLKLNTNPSGTAAVESAISDVENPLKAAPKAIAAYATNSNWFNNWLLRNPPPPSSDLVAFDNWRRRQFAALTLGSASVAQGGDAADEEHEKH